MSWVSDVWGRLAEGAPRTPGQVRIPDDHVFGAEPSRPFVAEQDYVVVEVNEVHLDYSRQFWQGYIPSVWASTQLRYAGQSRAVPVVIGSALLDQPVSGVPTAQLYRNTRVLGPVPYRGGVVGVSLVLSQIAVDNKATNLLGVLESLASAFDLKVTLAPYLAIGRAVSDGIGALLDLGSRPLFGVQDTITADAAATGGWYVMMDVQPLQPLWVVDGRLRTGPDPTSAAPVTGCTYVLYSVTALPGGQGRNDAAALPDLAEQRALAEQFAVRPDKRSWIAAKAVFSELGLRLLRHPDLTRTQAEQLFRVWGEDLVRVHEQAVDFAEKGPAAPLSPELAEIGSLVQTVMEL